MIPSAWVFGEVEIRPAERRVLRAGVPQALGGRAFDLLLALIERRGEVLSKDELMLKVWPGLVVEENNLTVHMSALRKAIGPAAISTVPGRGYQFTVEVAALADPHSGPMGNLPAQATRYVGRDADLAAVVALLGNGRMVTLTGVGGIGKTRLSLHVAAAVAPGFADGAWLVELASVIHPHAVVHAVAGALGVSQQAGKTMEQSLVEALRRRNVLLVLDNCEHLVNEVAALAKSLLAGCARITLLATSREALMVAGERNWPVPERHLTRWSRSPGIVISDSPDLVLTPSDRPSTRRRHAGVPMKNRPHDVWHRISLVALAALAACAIAPLQPDLSAKAPGLEGFGRSDTPVTTRSDAARRLYQAGVLQAFAFNEKEAVRQFKAALAADPTCAMCAWGVAWQLGPNINAQQRGDLTEARQYIDYAVRQAQNSSGRERALIDAMAARYGVAERAGTAFTPSEADVCRGARASKDADPLDTAYAERLHALVTAYPDDADILSLWSEAAMIAIKDDWYDKATGKALPRIAEMVDRLEALLQLTPEHIGLNHYLIHAADDASNAARATAAADRLATLAPASPHLVHMPAHIYVRMGRYADAAARNESALAAEDALDAAQKAQGFALSKDWRGHNTHFLWYAALMQGRGDAALAAARAMAERAKGDSVWSEYFRSTPQLTLLRLERWDALLAEPRPTGERGMAVVIGQQARGVALVRRARLPEARAALKAAEASAATLRAAHASASKDDVGLRNVADAMLARLRAELAAAERRTDEALAQQARAVAASKDADDEEPPGLAAGARLALGDLQLQLGRAADAEATFRADLAALPDSGWALRGLARALAAQGKAAEAAAVRARGERTWSQADAALKT